VKKKYPLIFVVEDNLAYSKAVVHFLKQNGYENNMNFTSGEECLQHLYLNPDIIIQDYKLQGISGLHVLRRTKKILPRTQFIFLSSQKSIDTAVNTMKHGAFDYIVKNETALQLLIPKIENIRTIQGQGKRNKTLRLFFILFISAIVMIGMAILIAD
jgi:DNA-binding NtrC family response regulator